MRTPIIAVSSPWKSASAPLRMLETMSERRAMSSGRKARTNAPPATPLAVTIAWPSTKGEASITSGSARMRWVTASQSEIGPVAP
jgi:hypothetical protein